MARRNHHPELIDSAPGAVAAHVPVRPRAGDSSAVPVRLFSVPAVTLLLPARTGGWLGIHQGRSLHVHRFLMAMMHSLVTP